jgi:hypothetical protein
MWAPACPENVPGSGFVYSCPAATNSCPKPGDLRYWVAYRDLTVRPADSWHRLAGDYCLSHNPTLDLGAVEANVERQFRDLPLPHGTITVEPKNYGVVNIPVIAFTDTPQQRVFSLTALGSSVTLTATPQTWSWHWGNGIPDSTTTGPSAGYPTCQAATSSCAAYTYTNTGSYGPVSVTVSWTATYTIAGVPQTFTIADPVAITSTGRVIRIVEAPAQLVYGGAGY